MQILKEQTHSPTRRGFSLMEVMAAIVIIAVVATASLSGLSSLRGKANSKMDQTNMAELNAKVEAYHLEHGKYPSASMKELATSGYVESNKFTTPFGGRYTFDRKKKKVINRYAPK